MKKLDEQIVRTKARAAALGSASLLDHVRELQQASEALRSSEVQSDEGKDLIKREKARARQVFVY